MQNLQEDARFYFSLLLIAFCVFLCVLSANGFTREDDFVEYSVLTEFSKYFSFEQNFFLYFLSLFGAFSTTRRRFSSCLLFLPIFPVNCFLRSFFSVPSSNKKSDVCRLFPNNFVPSGFLPGVPRLYTINVILSTKTEKKEKSCFVNSAKLNIRVLTMVYRYFFVKWVRGVHAAERGTHAIFSLLPIFAGFDQKLTSNPRSTSYKMD